MLTARCAARTPAPQPGLPAPRGANSTREPALLCSVRAPGPQCPPPPPGALAARGARRGARGAACNRASLDSAPGMAGPSAPPGPSRELVEFACALADEARAIVPRFFRQPLEVRLKADQSPVTQADEEVERAVRRRIADAYPAHAVLGEEEGAQAQGAELSEYTWVVDPIDGTASFVTGKPLFGVLIALLHWGQPVLGVLEQPVLKERWVGVLGQPTTFNGARVQTRPVPSLADGYLYTTSPHLFPTQPADKAFNRLRMAVRRTNYGCDCYAFGLLAMGFVDVALEYGVRPWDYMALVPIVQGAGGAMTDWKGQPLRLSSMLEESWPQHIVAVGDAALQEEVLGILQEGTLES